MIYYAVIDTNVLVSAMFSMESVPGIIVSEAIGGRIIPLISDEIVSEYKEVLGRMKFHFDRDAVMTLIDNIVKRGIPFDDSPIRELLPDPKDVVFYQVVMEARGREKTNSSYLVTGNTKHFPLKHYVVTPRRMLGIIQRDEGLGI